MAAQEEPELVATDLEHQLTRALLKTEALGDTLAEAVEKHAHAQHRGLMGSFERCVAEECEAARAWWAYQREVRD